MSTDNTNAAAQLEADFSELKSGAPIWITSANGQDKIAANYGKMHADGVRFQAKVPGKGYDFYPLSQFAGQRDPNEKPSSAQADAAKPANGTKGKSKAKAEGETKEASEPKIDREARKAEKAKAREDKKAEREARKAEKAAAREKAKAEKGTQAKKSRGNGIRLSGDVLAYLKQEIPVVSTEEGDQQVPVNVLAESMGRRVEDMEKAVNVLVEKKHVEIVKVEVPAEGETAAFSYNAVKLTQEGRDFVKPSSSRTPKAEGEKGKPMQERIAELVRQHKTNQEIMEALSVEPDENGEGGYKLARSFVSTVRSRMKDPLLYDFKYATAEDVDRDYLAERRTMDRQKKREEAAQGGEEQSDTPLEELQTPNEQLAETQENIHGSGEWGEGNATAPETAPAE